MNNIDNTIDTLDSIARECGKEIDVTKMKVADATKVVESVEAEMRNGDLAYGGFDIDPMGTPHLPTADEVVSSKEDAMFNATASVALEKLRKEQEQFNKMEDDEKIKKYVLESELHRNCTEFFLKNGYNMDGKSKRKLRRVIETAWAKGKYNLTPEQRDDILFELNKASKEASKAKTEEILNAQKGGASEVSKVLNRF